MKASRLIVYSLLAVIVAGGCYYYYFVLNAPKKLAAPPKLEKVLPKNFLAAMNGSPGQAQVANARPAPAAQPAAGAPAAAPENPVQFTGNGSDHLSVTVKNTGRRPIQVTVHPCEIYDNGKNRVVVLEGLEKQVAAGSTEHFDLRAAATSSANLADDKPYAKTTAVIPKLDLLIQKAQNRPEITHQALQTAILALAENPSLDLFAKFARLHGDAGFTNTAFKVDTADIISAMQLLSDCGVNDRAAAADPQLEIEAMIDPDSHDAAMRYFGITPEGEWAWWKHQLLEGDPSTRHYALYGIARYYPDVALVMLPKWAKEPRLSSIYRLSAVRALALTNRQEAIDILRQLEQLFGSDTALHQSADRAARYLSVHFNQPSQS